MSPLLSSLTFGIYILNLFRKSGSPITSATVFFRMFPYFHSVHWGLNPPLFLGKSHLKLANSPSTPFLGNLPTLYLCIGFS